MTNEFNNQPYNGREFYDDSAGWVAQITRILTMEITWIVTLAISFVVTLLVLAGGVWLMSTYLPANIFTIIMGVILLDILLGIVVRFVVLHYRRRNENR